MGKKQKLESPFKLAAKLDCDLRLADHLASHADLFSLTTLQRTRLVIASRLARVPPAAIVAGFYQTGGWPVRDSAAVDGPFKDRFVAIVEAIRDSVAEPVQPGKPFKVEFDHPIGESLVEHLATNARSMALSEAQQARLNEAFRLFGKAKNEAKTLRNDEVSALKTEAFGIAAAVQDELGAALGESVDLELARNGRVTRSNGKTRFHDRDGLAALFDAGALDGDVRDVDDAETMAGARLSAGLDFRQMLECSTSDLRSQLGGDSGGAGDLDAFRFYRARDGVMRSELEALVGFAVGSRGLMALRLVAGEGRLISSIGQGGKCIKLNTHALIRALDVVAVKLRIPGSALLTSVPE